MPPYLVEDQYVDPTPPTDAWGSFLAARFSNRQELFGKFSEHEQQIVRKELRRIRHLRDYFEGHRLAAADATSLLASLDRAHADWRRRAGSGCKEELHRLEVGIARASGYRRQNLNRQRLIVKQTQQWGTPEDLALKAEQAPEAYIPGLYGPEDGLDDNPAESNYGCNGWVMNFKKGQGGVTLDHPLCHGKFPHQKIAMQKLLYDEERTPLKRSSDRTQLRYFHLQANNMKWVEVFSGHSLSASTRGQVKFLLTSYSRTRSPGTMGKTAVSWWSRTGGCPSAAGTNLSLRRSRPTRRSC